MLFPSIVDEHRVFLREFLRLLLGYGVALLQVPWVEHLGVGVSALGHLQSSFLRRHEPAAASTGSSGFPAVLKIRSQAPSGQHTDSQS